jgi:mRNA interferase HigB
MRTIKESCVQEFIRKHADAKSALETWVALVRKARWSSIGELRAVFPSADGVEVASKRTATVFNIRGNRYRLITAIHYRTGCIYVMRFLTHAEYNKDTWKDDL